MNRSIVWAGVLCAFALVTSTGCCAGARDRALTYSKLNELHARDDTLPQQAREIAQDNADAWAVQAFELGGPEPSADVVARVEAE